jgi:hypothetical protein
LYDDRTKVDYFQIYVFVQVPAHWCGSVAYYSLIFVFGQKWKGGSLKTAMLVCGGEPFAEETLSLLHPIIRI